MSTQYAPKIVTDNLVLCLDASNTKSYPGTNPTWTDISNSGNNGTVNVTLGVSAAFIQGSPSYFDFDNNSSKYIAFTPTTGFGSANKAPACTLGAWVRLTRKTVGAIRYQYVAGFRNSSDFDFYFLILDNGTSPINTEARLRTGTSLYDILVDYTNYYDNWTYITFVASSSRTDLYLNGSLVGSNLGVAGTFGSDSGVFRAGLSPNGDYAMLGRMSQIQFYTKSLTSSEVLQNYNATKGRYGL